MLFKSVAVAALAACAQAEWAWVKSFSITGPANEIASARSAYISKASQYWVTVTTGAEFNSARSEMSEYLATRTGVPSIVKNTALTAVMTYTAKPDWWDAAPAGAKSYFEKQLVETENIVKEVQDSINLGVGLYANGALVVVIAILAVVL